MLHTRVYFSRMCYQIAPRVLHFSAFIFNVMIAPLIYTLWVFQLPIHETPLPTLIKGTITHMQLHPLSVKSLVVSEIQTRDTLCSSRAGALPTELHVPRQLSWMSPILHVHNFSSELYPTHYNYT